MKKGTLAQFAHTQAAARLRKLDAELHRAARNPEDPEAIHDLRVAIRRFTQCLRSFGQFFDPAPIKKIRRRLRKLLDRCGAVRNCDIAVELLQSAGLGRSAIAVNLRKQRRQAELDLVAHLEPWRKKRVLRRWITHLRIAGQGAGTWDPAQTAAQNAGRELPRLAKDLFVAGHRAAAVNAKYDTLHRFRLLAKRFRYTLELFAPVYGAQMKRRLGELRRLQDKLGVINDCVTSREMVKGHRQAEAAIGKLLVQRESEFRSHWKQHFTPQMKTAWEAWLSQSIQAPEGS